MLRNPRLIILAIIVVPFVWGPRKLPEFARSIGLARREMEKAHKETSSLTKQMSDLTLPTRERPETDALIETAKRLGISTEERPRHGSQTRS